MSPRQCHPLECCCPRSHFMRYEACLLLFMAFLKYCQCILLHPAATLVSIENNVSEFAMHVLNLSCRVCKEYQFLRASNT